MRNALLKALLCVCVLGAAAAPARAEELNLAGRWEGSYNYPPWMNRESISFVMDLTVKQSAISGRMREPNTFGDPKERFLFADVRGIIEGRRVRLMKTYDGTGGQDHSVYYEGIVDTAGANIFGIWVISEGWGGRFEATKR